MRPRASQTLITRFKVRVPTYQWLDGDVRIELAMRAPINKILWDAILRAFLLALHRSNGGNEREKRDRSEELHFDRVLGGRREKCSKSRESRGKIYRLNLLALAYRLAIIMR